MKVCHFTSVHAYNDVRIFLKECMSLKEAGYEVHLIACNVLDGEENGIIIHSVNKSSGSRLKRMLSNIRLFFLKAIEIDAQVYHFHDPELIPVGLLLKNKGKKVIYDAHEDVPQQIQTKHWIPRYIRKPVAKLVGSFEKYASKRIDGVVSATPTITNKFKKYGCFTVNINNYPLLSEFKQLHKKNGSSHNRAVCYVGGISKVRGIYEMILSIIDANATLLLAGNYADMKEKEKAMKISGYDQHIQELGYLDREQIIEVYSKSNAGLVVLHPTQSYLDSLPVKLFEYMASELPVIVSDFPLWKEIVEGCNCGICVDPYDTKAISEAIQLLIDDRVRAEEMGRNGRVAVETKYNWNNEKDKLLAFYHSLNNLERS